MDEKKLKELEHKASYLSTGQERAETLLELSKLLSERDYLRSWSLANEAIQEAEHISNQEIIAGAHIQAASALWKLADYSSALDHYTEALNKYQLLDDQHGKSLVYCGIGIVHGELNDNDNAITFFEKAIEAATKAGNENFCGTLLNNIGFVRLHNYENEEALECFLKSLEIHEIYDDKLGKSNALGGAAGAYVYMRKFNMGLEYLEKALRLNQQIDNQRGIALTLMNYGETHYQLGNYTGAIQYSNRALEVAERINLISLRDKVHEIISKAYSAIGDEDSAHKHMKLYAEAEKESKAQEVQRKVERHEQLQQIKNLKAGS